MLRFLRPTPRRIAVLLAATVGIGAGAAYAASLSVGSWHLWAGSQTLTKATCTLAGVGDDRHVRRPEASAGHELRDERRRRSSARTAAASDWMFIRFDLSSCNIPTTGGADTATLTLTVTTAPGNTRTLTVTPVLVHVGIGHADVDAARSR